MIYTKLTKTALKICFNAHKEQVDKSGIPYVFHPFHIAEQMTDEYSTAAALLHDVIEDSNITFDELKIYGIPDNVIDAIKLLTYNNNMPYLEYIKKIKDNQTAKEVKLADLKHNIDFTRLDDITADDIQRNKKYAAAISILEN